jgi:hypothetical protein
VSIARWISNRAVSHTQQRKGSSSAFEPPSTKRLIVAVPRYIHESASASRPVSCSRNFRLPPRVPIAVSARNA